MQDDVEVAARAGRECPPEFLGQLTVEGAEQLARHVRLPEEERPAAQVDGRRYQRLVHRDRGVAVAPNARLVAQGLLHRLAQADADILDGVMRIDVQVAGRPDGQVDEAVPGQQGKHVIEEADAGLYLRRAGPIEVQLQVDGSLAGFSVNAGGSAHVPPSFFLPSPPALRGRGEKTAYAPGSPIIVFNSVSRRSISSSVPTVMRSP